MYDSNHLVGTNNLLAGANFMMTFWTLRSPSCGTPIMLSVGTVQKNTLHWGSGCSGIALSHSVYNIVTSEIKLVTDTKVKSTKHAIATTGNFCLFGNLYIRHLNRRLVKK